MKSPRTPRGESGGGGLRGRVMGGKKSDKTGADGAGTPRDQSKTRKKEAWADDPSKKGAPGKHGASNATQVEALNKTDMKPVGNRRFSNSPRRASLQNKGAAPKKDWAKTYTLPTKKVTDEELIQAKECFMNMDKDHNGEVDIHEMRQMLNSLGQNPSDQELKNMLNIVDGSGNGKIELREFLEWFQITGHQQKEGAAQHDDVTDCFRCMGGTPTPERQRNVTKAEVRRMLLEDYELDIDVDEIFLDADKDGSGTIDLDSFKNFLVN